MYVRLTVTVGLSARQSITTQDKGVSMNELTLKTNCYLTTQVGTQITRKSTKAEWENYGEILRRVDEAKQWAIGDWLADGKRHYGDGLYKRAVEITGQSARTLEDYKRMSDAFEITLRNVELTYNHHKEVASIKKIGTDKQGKLYLSDEPDKDKIEELLKEAEKRKRSVVELREQVRDYKEWQRQHIAAANEPEKYAVIYADPPWQYNSGDQHSTEEQETVLGDHYPSMVLDDIIKLPQAKLAATDSLLFLWCTSPVLEEAFSVINSWGFNYKASMIWDKVAHNVGHYVSVRHEILLIATKGIPPKVTKLVDSVYSEERSEHSRKPVYFRNVIDELYPQGKRIELFCRGQVPSHWDSWGKEAD
jgi:N6-adenosine-specific RNA methylase IME4